MQITLDDLLVLEPHLRRLAGGDIDAADAGSEAALTWAVSARATPPHLPPLRGGELVLVPPSASESIGPSLAGLFGQAMERGVSALIFEEGDPRLDITHPESNVPPLLMWNGTIAAETETTINRRLTERRSALYQLGSDLERRLTDLAVAQAGLAPTIAVAAEATGLPIAVTDADGQSLAAQPGSHLSGAGIPERGGVQVTRALPLGATLVLGPLLPEQRVVARFVVDRVAAAAGAALGRDEAARPRGTQRARATAQLLGELLETGERRAAALALGLDPEGLYVVAVARGIGGQTLARELASLGAFHPASGSDEQRTALIGPFRRANLRDLAGQVGAIKRRWATERVMSGETLAISSPAVGVEGLPEAARQARFIASLQASGRLARPAASFEALDDLGVMSLLYHWRDSSALRAFVTTTLGPLVEHDPRGTLRTTLRAFLEAGGSQVEAAQRLGIHRNTLAYRLRRIADLLERDITSPETWLPLHLALHASDTFEAVARPT